MRWQALDAAGTTPASAALAAEDLSDPPQPSPEVITARTLTTDGLQLAGLNRGPFMPKLSGP